MKGATLTKLRVMCATKDKNSYLRRHESELLLHDGAKNMLKRMGISTKNLDVDKLHSEYNALYSKKAALQNTYNSAGKEIKALERKLDNLNQYLNRALAPQPASGKALDKNRTSL